MSDTRWRLGARFALLEQMGAGAAGTLWRAQELHDGSLHAVRVLRPELVTDPPAVSDLYAALGAVARIGHPGIVAVDDAANGDGWLALRSPLVAGESLRALLARHGAMHEVAAVHVVAQVCDAVAAAHAAGIAHGDIHPGNVLLLSGANGQLPHVVVTDFAMAGLGAAPPPEYRAPDAVACSPQADVYAMGVMLYECLAGQRSLIPVPGVPEALWTIIAACLAGDPAHRPAAAGLAAALRGPGAHETPAAPLLHEAPTTLLPSVVTAAPELAPAPAPGRVRLPRLILEHKTESGIAAAVLVTAALIGAALSLGGGSAAPAASTSPATRTASASAATDTPQAVVLPPGSLSPSPSPSASPSPSMTGPIQLTLVNTHSNTCIDTAGRIFANGTKEDIYTCNGTPAQAWTLTPAGQLTEDGGAYCLDDYGLEKTPGTPVVLWSCNGGPNQRWIPRPDGEIVSANAGLCLDVSGKGTGDGTPLVLSRCDGSPSQHWAAR